MAMRLAVVNFKGGVGKTTLALHIGCYLARRQDTPRVLLVDVDHQSSLSIVVLDEPRWETAYNADRTVNRIFRTLIAAGITLPKAADVISRRPFVQKHGQQEQDNQPNMYSYPNLDILPSQFELDDTEIDLAATTIGNAIESEWRKRTLLCQWLHESGVDRYYDFIIFDCPPATKLVSQNAIAASHAYVVPVIPDEMSIRGVTHFVNMVANKIDGRLNGYMNAIPAQMQWSTFVPNTQLAGIVISNAQTHGAAAAGFVNEHVNGMRALRNKWGNHVLGNVIERGVGVAESLSAGWPVFDQLHNPNVTNRDFTDKFENVCDELFDEDHLEW